MYTAVQNAAMLSVTSQGDAVMGTQDAETWDIGHKNVATEDTGTCGGMG